MGKCFFNGLVTASFGQIKWQLLNTDIPRVQNTRKIESQIASVRDLASP